MELSFVVNIKMITPTVVDKRLPKISHKY
jgi:hypothetical protein